MRTVRLALLALLLGFLLGGPVVLGVRFLVVAGIHGGVW